MWPNCPLCEVVHYCAGSKGTKMCPLYRIAGCPLLGGLNNIILKAMEIQSGHSELSIILQVSTIEYEKWFYIYYFEVSQYMREGYGSWSVRLSVITLAATYLICESNFWCCKVPYGVPNA